MKHTSPIDYYDALRQCSHRYAEMTSGDPESALADFVGDFAEAITTRQPLMKLNRWLGYIQGALIAQGITTIEAERDWTRPLFRPLDFQQAAPPPAEILPRLLVKPPAKTIWLWVDENEPWTIWDGNRA